MPTFFGVRAITPSPINVRAIERAILKEKAKKGKDIVKELEKTVRTWAGEKPRFKARVKDRGQDVVIEITLTGTELALDKWKWLDEGTDPHPISGSPRLAFLNSGPAVGGRAYVPKTIPGRLMSRAGAPAEGPLHFPESVQHPGFPARNWTKMIRDMMERDFGKRIRIVLKRVIEKKEAH